MTQFNHLDPALAINHGLARVIEIKVPTLRERGEDVALLARHFLDQFGGRYAKPGIDLAPTALKLLQLGKRALLNQSNPT